jgi:hypothetical protein
VKSGEGAQQPDYSGQVRSLVVVLLALLAALVGTGCGSSSDESAPPPATLTESETAPADSAREAAPPLTGITLDGDAIALGDFRGRPVLVNVWSSW